METEQGSQILSISKRGRQLQELPSVDQEEFSAPPRKGLNLRPLLRTVQRKALLVVGIAGVVTVGAWYLTKSAPSVYEGNFRLLVEPVTNEARAVDPSSLTRANGDVPGEDNFELDYATQLEILKSPKMLTEILEQIRTKYPDFKYEQLKQGLVVERFQSEDPKITDPTKMLEVSFQGEVPEQVQFVLEVTANKYLKYSLDERKSRIGEGVKFIEDQLPALQKRVDNLQSQRQRLQQQYKLTDPNVQSEDLFTQIREISTQLRDAQSQLQEQKTLYTNIQNQLALTPNEAIAASALSEDPSYTELQARVQELDNQIAVESSRFLPDSPSVQALQAKRQNLVSLQNQQTQRILGQSGAGSTNNPQVLAFQNSVRLDLINQLVTATNQIEVLELRTQALAQTKASFEQQLRQLPTLIRQYNDIQQQLEIATRTRDQLLAQRETLRVEAAQTSLPWEIFSQPQIPLDPTGKAIPVPSKARNIQMMGAVLGLLLGVGAALLIEKSRNIFYTTEEIKESIPLPLLGVIPLYKNAGKLPKSNTFNSSEIALGGSEFATSPFLEAFDSLYASIRFLSSDPPVRSLAVCSASRGDGKTTIALHLAQTAAAMGQRVLLVDANLRQPQLHTHLDLPNQKGLSDLLSKKLDPNDFIQRSQVADNLFVLTSGHPQANSTKLLGSAQMQYLMEEFQATFDLVIYDTSHLVGFMDANFLAAHTDGVLMVVGVGKTSRSLVMQVLNQLNTFRLPTLGVVANHVRKGAKSPSNTVSTSGLKLVEEELPAHQGAGKWTDYQLDKAKDRKSS
jgi:capsular exopolysaccharide synthesis family protein